MHYHACHERRDLTTVPPLARHQNIVAIAPAQASVAVCTGVLPCLSASFTPDIAAAVLATHVRREACRCRYDSAPDPFPPRSNTAALCLPDHPSSGCLLAAKHAAPVSVSLAIFIACVRPRHSLSLDHLASNIAAKVPPRPFPPAAPNTHASGSFQIASAQLPIVPPPAHHNGA